jgi:aryl-alcohol dehydrogenase-like predicted oxidoreductase
MCESEEIIQVLANTSATVASCTRSVTITPPCFPTADGGRAPHDTPHCVMRDNAPTDDWEQAMEMRFLGATGLRVSAFALGTMGFGGGTASPVGDVDLDDARRQVGMALDAGVNLFDTANGYSAGRAEELLGLALGTRRDDVLVSTKAHVRTGPGPNDVGQSRWNLVRSCESSLRRLGTDHIDLFHVHGFDGCTPLEESLAALDRLVRDGKVRYIACSNFTAWQLAKAMGISDRLGLDHYVAYQGYYSLVGRDMEHEILPACRDLGVGVLVWSPLAGGLLSGKVHRHTMIEGTRRSLVGDLGVGPIDHDHADQVIEVAEAVARTRGCSVAQVALNWVRSNETVTSVIVGARTTEQLADNLAAASWSLEPDERHGLDVASAIALPYPHWFQRQFTTERYSPTGPPDPSTAHLYDRPNR